VIQNLILIYLNCGVENELILTKKGC